MEQQDFQYIAATLRPRLMGLCVQFFGMHGCMANLSVTVLTQPSPATSATKETIGNVRKRKSPANQ